MKAVGFVVLALVLLSATSVEASTEINGLFDARSAGMGGTGVAYLDSAGAIPTNPALLDQIGKLTLTADAFVIVAQPVAPYTVYHLDAAGQQYANYETVVSPAAAAVLPFVGGAYRLFDRVVVGAAVYPMVGQGTSAKYRPAPDELPALTATNEAALGLVEAGIPVSVRLLDNLSLGVMWRVTYMTMTVSTPVPTGTPPAGVLIDREHNKAINADIAATGWDFAGAQIGLFYKVLPNLRLGFSYRNKVVVDGSGTTTTRVAGKAIVLDTERSFANPHSFRVGFAWTTFRDKLLLAADFKYLMYADAWAVTKTTTTMPGKPPMTDVRPTHWRDSYNFQIGAEYKLSDMFRVRAGYIGLTSATNAAYAQQLMAPPGFQHLGSAGFGIAALDNLNIDIAAAYLVLQSQVTTATQYNAGVGTYASHGGEFSLSATYHN
jgi:long-chain fatty acid transport protein